MSNQTKNISSFSNQNRSLTVNDFLLMETGDYLLLETGDKIILEQSNPTNAVYTNQIKN